MWFVALLNGLIWAHSPTTDFTGTWELESRDNLDAYLDSREVSTLLQYVVKCTHNQQIIEQNGHDFVLTVNLSPCVAPSKSIVRRFNADGFSEYKGEMYDGQPITWVSTLESGRLISVAKTPTGQEVVSRRIVDGKMVQTNVHKGVVMTQYFVRSK
jgi:hypothetical protein